MSETLKEVVEQEDESQIVAQDAHNDYYDSRSIIPADNVDADGVPWATVGENIRNGAKASPSKEKVLEALSALLGVEVKYEVVTCTIKADTIVSTDNALFIGEKNSIRSRKTILAFFILSTNSNSGFANIISQFSSGVNTVHINMQGSGVNAINGIVKLGVLLA